MNKNIAILWGGDSAEYEISKNSGKVVAQNLSTEKYSVFPIEVTRKGWIYRANGRSTRIDKNDFTLTLNGKKIFFDLAFIAIHGTPGEDGKLQGYFDLLNIPYSCSGVFASSLSFNKSMCNSLLSQFGVTCGKAVYLKSGETIDNQKIADEIGLPCFVKPNQAGSSHGVSKVSELAQLPKAVTDAFAHDDTVIIEEFLQGREVTCGVHNFEQELTAMPITEIISENDFFDFEAKYEGKSQELTPAQISDAVAELVEQTAKRIYRILDLDGVARADFILRKGTPYLIEVNTIPGLSAESIVPQQAQAMGYKLEDFLDQWVTHAMR